MRNTTKILIKLRFFLVFLFFFISVTDVFSDEIMGQEIFVAECVGCHAIKPPKEAESINIVLQKKAPSLRYAGSKFKDSFLLSWLIDPEPIRPLVYNSLTETNTSSHKRLTPAQASDVTQYLLTLRVEDFIPKMIEPKENLLGKQIFAQRYSCYSCHRTRGDDGITGGLSGPSLVKAGERLRPEWIYAFLSDPRLVLDKGSMPTYAGIINERDLVELTKYLATFK